MDSVSTELRQAVDNIGQIVRRDGGALDLQTFDPEAGELVVAFRRAPADECATCAIDEPMVRAFLEEAVRAQGIRLTSLRIQASEA